VYRGSGLGCRRLSLGSAEKHEQRCIFRRSPELRYHGKHDGKVLATQIVLNDEVAKNDLVLWLPNCLQELAQVRKPSTQRSRLPIVRTRDKISTLYFLGLGGCQRFCRAFPAASICVIRPCHLHHTIHDKATLHALGVVLSMREAVVVRLWLRAKPISKDSTEFLAFQYSSVRRLNEIYLHVHTARSYEPNILLLTCLLAEPQQRLCPPKTIVDVLSLTLYNLMHSSPYKKCLRRAGDHEPRCYARRTADDAAG
jgi:hypothetical protein